MKDSINFNLFIALSSATFDLISFNNCLNFIFSAFKSNLSKISLIASAPIPASNESTPYCSCALIYSSSERS
jgi:hypothetical protein